MSYDLEELKARLPEYLSIIGVPPACLDGTKLKAPCPLHDDNHPSLVAELKSNVWLWYCHPCQKGGTTIDLHAFRQGITPTSRDNLKSLSDLLRVPSVISSEYLPKRTAENQNHREGNRHQESDQKRLESLTSTITEKRLDLISPYLSKDWRADLWHESPAIPAANYLDQCLEMLIGLFKPQDTLWMGDLRDTGSPHHANNFRSRREWVGALGEPLPPRLAGGIFEPGSTSRAQASLIESPFLVIESDELIGHKPRTQDERMENKRLSAALFGFLQDRLKLHLRAVIDTGGKSLHGWFDRPSIAGVKALATLIHGLAIDSAVFSRCANSPLRAPGCLHKGTGSLAELIYLDPLPFR